MMRFGLIGLGRHGLRYARHLLEPASTARLTAVCRRDAAQGRAFAERHGLRFHADWHELIADAAVDAVVVVTPPSLTRRICLACVQQRKPMLIEKPLSVTGDDARAMVQAAEAAKVPLMTAQTLRFDTAVQALKAALPTVAPGRYLVLANRIEPRPELFRDPAQYGGRGVLLEIGIHLLDLLRFLTGEEVQEVRCETDVVGTPESCAWAWLRTTSGFPCLLEVSRVAAGRMSRAEWIGENGQLVADWSRHQLSRVSSSGVADASVPDSPTVVAAIQAFIEALEQGRPMPVTGWDGQRAVAIADACYESAATGRTASVQP